MTITTYEYSPANVAIAEATPQPRHVWIDCPRAIYVYTGDDLPQLSEPRTISIQKFRDRLTEEETLAILAAEKSDDLISYAIWLLSTQEDGLLHLDNPMVSQTMAHLMQLGLLTQERVIQLLT